jgi:tetratricopeptide (TPR) repeat protein
MDTLHSLVQSLSKEEIRFYKLYTQRYATGVDGLSTRLFDLMRRDVEESNDQLIFEKIYTKNGDKNTFYRLKNRLQSDLCDALTMLHFDKHEANELHRFMCVYNILYQKGEHELAYYFIRKAEKRAVQTENLELLDLIYADIVKLSNEIISINPEEYVAKQTDNALHLNRMRQMDQVLAVLNYRVKVTQNFQKGNETLLKLVDKTVKDFAKDKSISENRIFQIKIYRAISQAMVQKRRFKELETFLLKTYIIFQQKKWFDKETHDVHLQMLVYIINAYLMQKKFAEALEHVKILGDEMIQFDKLFYDKFIFFYYNSLIIVYQEKDNTKALSTLNEFEQINRKNKNIFYEQFIYTNRALIYFYMQKYDDAIRTLTKLYVTDYYAQADRNFKLKVEVSEIIMQYESGDYSTVEKRLKQIRKTYKDLLKDETLKTERAILDILQALASAQTKKPDTKTGKKITALISEMKKEEDIPTQVINYMSWLESIKKKGGI